jgi:hypothetical protein
MASMLPGAITFPETETEVGFLARLLVNENPFPGEHGYRSESETRAGMEAVLLVLDARLRRVPSGYRQVEIAAVTTSDLMEIITAGGQRGQVDGFFRHPGGSLAVVPRVNERLDYLLTIANTGPPGKFARLLQHAQSLAESYLAFLRTPEDPYLRLRWLGTQAVTGRAYSWMTDNSRYHPGGRFVAIPPDDRGVVGGNHYFTLCRLSPEE